LVATLRLVVVVTFTRLAGKPISDRVRSTRSALRRDWFWLLAVWPPSVCAAATATRSKLAFGRRSSARETAE